jgi:putative spermidine/putrescine transport system permease protein
MAISFEPRAFIAFPPSGFTTRWYTAIGQSEQLLDSIGVSLRTAALVMVISLLLGVPAAFACVRGRFPGRTAINALLLSPQMMPGMVIGIATLFFGAYFAFRQSNLMLVLSLAVFCLPLAIRIVMARLAGLDPILDEASANLGAGSVETFCRVTLPQIWTAVIAAAAFVFIEAFDNVTIALFTSDVRGRPLSVELYYLVQYDSTPMIAAVSSLEISLSLLVMIVLARTVGLDRLSAQNT